MVLLRTFDEMRGDCDWLDTVAYWMGTCRGNRMDAERLLGIGGQMEYQYDVEEQAHCFGAPFPEDASWRRFFLPITPIQLALRWSPIPLAIEVLGDPCCEANELDDMGCSLVVLFWNSSQVTEAHMPDSQNPQADVRRFLGLLGIAIARGREKGRGLLLVVKPGWAYDAVHKISDETKSIMERHGFVVTDRHP